MGVYIPDMKMPNTCEDCEFGIWSNLHQTLSCKRNEYEPCFDSFSEDYRTKRALFCPLIDISLKNKEDISW